MSVVINRSCVRTFGHSISAVTDRGEVVGRSAAQRPTITSQSMWVRRPSVLPGLRVVSRAMYGGAAVHRLTQGIAKPRQHLVGVELEEALRVRVRQMRTHLRHEDLVEAGIDQRRDCSTVIVRI